MSSLRIGLIHVSQETNEFQETNSTRARTTLACDIPFGLHEGADVIASAGATGQEVVAAAPATLRRMHGQDIGVVLQDPPRR